ncbi:MAG: D-alanyl-D-alanine carboxypeptidase/D-alanyl-D-alanine-endopeptidase [bacterium]
MKKMVMFLFLTVQTCYVFGQNSNNLVKEKLDSLLNVDYFKTCLVAVDAYDLTTDTPIYSANERYLLTPASNQKVLTTTAALLFLGENYNFSTSVYYTGKIKDSVCSGDIYFVGGMDPDFTSADLSFMVSKVKEMGINKIAGNVYGDVSAMDSSFWGPGWMWDDDPSSDFPYLTPLIINDACVKIAYQPGEKGTPPIVEGIPKSSFYSIENNAVTTSEKGKRFFATRDWLNRNNKFIIGGNLKETAEPDTDKINVCNSNAYFLILACEELNAQGIKVPITVKTGLRPIDAEHIYTFDRPFGQVIVNLNKTSDNLSAEMTFRAMALKYYGKPALPENGGKIVDSLIYLSGKNPKNYCIVDGSGVSRYNLISAELLNGVVKYIYKTNPDLFKILYDSFPVGGVDGTLRSRMKNETVFSNVHAKTGTLSGVSSLTGYMNTKNGHIISFSILTQNFVGSASKVRTYQDEICEILFNIN